MTNPKLKFVNHASYILENNETLLLHDPWLENGAFNNGWSLLCKEHTNKDLIEYLKKTNKKVFIWISHEHSDHFSIPFFKELKKSDLDTTIFFQKTIDKRVINYLESQNFEVIECMPEKEYLLDSNFSITVYPHLGGDSFCEVIINEKRIVNLNDCIVRSHQSALSLLNRLKSSKKIDILFTQFGYANWIGREQDIDLRKDSAKEKIQRIQIQNEIFQPIAIIPFASFVFFCKKDNFYMNMEQNSPLDIRNYEGLKDAQKKINFMKPMQEIELGDTFLIDLQHESNSAEDYWIKLLDLIKKDEYKFPLLESSDFENILDYGKNFIAKVRKETLFIVPLFELLKLMNLRRLKIYIYDLDKSISVSYLKGLQLLPFSKRYDFALHSSELEFLFKNEFGWNTLFVSGSFKTSNSSINKIHSFFRWQDDIKNGFSFTNPLYTIRVTMNYFFNKIFG